MLRITINTLLVLVLCSPGIVFAKRLNSEKYYQDLNCKGVTEVVLSDQTRCDCVTDTHSIEYDFASKYLEGLGQALHYAKLTGKKPGVALIIESEKDEKYLKRLRDTADFYHENYGLKIDIEVVRPEASADIEKKH